MLTALLLALVFGQTSTVVTNPRFAEFSPSADHNTVVNGTEVLQYYTLAIYQSGSSVAVQVVNLGKPSISASGKITVDFLQRLTSPLLAKVVYEARIGAVGPGGSVEDTTPSNTFYFILAPKPPTNVIKKNGIF